MSSTAAGRLAVRGLFVSWYHTQVSHSLGWHPQPYGAEQLKIVQHQRTNPSDPGQGPQPVSEHQHSEAITSRTCGRWRFEAWAPEACAEDCSFVLC